MNPQPRYSYLSKILRSCVLEEGQETVTEGEKDAAYTTLKEWVERTLEADGSPVALSLDETKTKFLASVEELLESAQDWDPSSDEEGSGSYQRLRFLDHLLRITPTPIDTISRGQDRTKTEIRTWLEDEPGEKEVQSLGEFVLNHFRALCKVPERPRREIPQAPLDSFSSLVYLGTLRQAFEKLYSGSPPKSAQAAYLPKIFRLLDQGFHNRAYSRFLVVAPTNGGKNGMILAAALAAVSWGRGPVIVLQPYRAQIAESRDSWKTSVEGIPFYREGRSPRGVKVAGSSAIISDADRSIKSGRIDITAIIPEKLSVLSRDSSLSSLCSFLICDEVIHLLDPQRGPKLEIMLTLAKDAKLPIMATGAGLADKAAERIARWLGDKAESDDPRRDDTLIFDPAIKRDPPLERWAWRRDGSRLKEGRFIIESVQPFEGSMEEAVSELVVRELTDYPRRQILVFLESRERVVRLADQIASRLKASALSLRTELAKAADDSEAGPLRDVWLGGVLPTPTDVPTILEQRVGVHTRDVPKNNLARIERNFRNGRLRVLCATTTVEAGINLPVDTVIQVGSKSHTGDSLNSASIEQRFGRAGRTLGTTSRAGKGIIYIDKASEPIDRIFVNIRRMAPRASSTLDAEYRAVLILVYLCSFSAKDGASKESLNEILEKSYWAFGQKRQDIKKRTEEALTLIQRQALAEARPPEKRNPIYIPTALGKAMAAALLTPSDAGKIAAIVDVARTASPGRAWMPEVLFAANHVPSLLHNSRRPREKDVITRGHLELDRVLASWVFADPKGSGFLFGFPEPQYKKMKLGEQLNIAAESVRSGSISEHESRRLLRTYICWLWANGEPVEVGKHVRNLSEHVVRQDLGDYLSHLLRCASWAAHYQSLFLLELRLREISRQVAYGVDAEALEFFMTCHEHVSRSQIAQQKNADFENLLHNFGSKLADELRSELSRKRDRRLSLRIDNLIQDQATDPDNKVLFERVENSQDLMNLLAGVLFEGASDLVAEWPNQVRTGRFTFFISLDNEEPESDVSFIFYPTKLRGGLRSSRQLRKQSILGIEEFVALTSALNGMTSWQQDVLLGALAACRRICFPELIDAVQSEIRGNDNYSTLQELYAPPESVVDKMIAELLKSTMPLFRSTSASRPSLAYSKRRAPIDNARHRRVSWMIGKLKEGQTKVEKALEEVVSQGDEYVVSAVELKRARERSARVQQLEEELSRAANNKRMGEIERKANEVGIAIFTAVGWEAIVDTYSQTS